MTVRWLLQENMRNQLSLSQMIEALNRSKIDYTLVPLTPFVEELPEEALPIDSVQLVCWGPGFVPRVLKHRISPGIWYDNTQFRWSSFQKNWKDLMLSSNVKILPFDKAKSELTSDPVFIRPDEDSKAFDGGIFCRDRPPQPGKNFTDFQVVVAPIQSVQDEWRFFVVDHNIIGASSYRILGQPNFHSAVPEKAKVLAEEAIKLWGPSEVYCLDIGHSDGNYGIVEANCFNASRLYGVDPVVIVQAVSKFANTV